ncbi:MAG: hypothetical protein U5L45_03135 [Saprospiraceae bacterium]|nr:hypothetical protein [Saprospiraceae bacterium]
MVHFSGKARKMNHLSPLCASEASIKAYFYVFLNFMYGFKLHSKVQMHKSFTERPFLFTTIEDIVIKI